jgi:DNA-binding NarL/FixJ family response regulator
MIADGNSNKEIAGKLTVSEESIEEQVRIILSSWARTTARDHQLAALARVWDRFS